MEMRVLEIYKPPQKREDSILEESVSFEQSHVHSRNDFAVDVSKATSSKIDLLLRMRDRGQHNSGVNAGNHIRKKNGKAQDRLGMWQNIIL